MSDSANANDGKPDFGFKVRTGFSEIFTYVVKVFVVVLILATGFCYVASSSAPSIDPIGPVASIPRQQQQHENVAEPGKENPIEIAPVESITRSSPAKVAASNTLAADVLFAQCSPAVVKVEVRDRQDKIISEGSGFLVGVNVRLFATNYHVVRDAHSAHIVLTHGRKLPVEGVLAIDEDADIAMLKIDEWISTRPLALAHGSLPPIGAKVFAIGNPLGLTQTLSDGLVSGHRAKGSLAERPRMPTLIQTTAPISPGSSGGPLISADGKVVGVTTLGFKNGQNLNLAVPAIHIAKLLGESIDEKPVSRFPLSANAISKSTTSSVDWSADDLENASHFVRAGRAAQKAIALTNDRPWQPGDPPEIFNGSGTKNAKTGKPWLLGPSDLREFERLMSEANRAATHCQKKVLQRLHPELPNAYKDFISATAYLSTNAANSHLNSDSKVQWARWNRWHKEHRGEIRIPEGAR